MIFLCGLLLSLSARLTAVDEGLNANLEPGHVKQDYDSMEEVRGHQNVTETEKPAEDEHLMREAILDVAYYLRRFKFSAYDPRHLTGGQIPKRNLFAEFPSPPLRNIHWEVKKYCEPSFVECVKYLQEQVSQTVLPRHLDSLTITKQNGWSFITDRDLIKAADKECLKLLHQDDQTFEVFFGPLQRFQWLTSASYYMCFYTMKETSYLKTFTEECDNYASCIQWELGYSNKDVRGDNRRPFACALYSFCPDPCCPLKYLPDWSACTQKSPCAGDFIPDRTCSFSRKANTNFDSLLLNEWNISCKCDHPGFRWESKSGMCVDIDECVELESACDYPSETCRNLPGSYKCVCSALGYRSNPDSQTCEKDPILQEIFYPPHPPPQNETIPLTVRFSDKLGQVWRSCVPWLKSFWLWVKSLGTRFKSFRPWYESFKVWMKTFWEWIKSYALRVKCFGLRILAKYQGGRNRAQSNRTETNQTETNRTHPKPIEANRTHPKPVTANRTHPKPVEANRTEPKFVEADLTQSNRTQPKRIKSNRTQTKHTEANRTEPNRTQPKRIKGNRTQTKHMEANRTEPKCIQSDLTQSNRTQPKRIKTNRIEQNRTEPKFIESDLTQSNRTHPKHIKSNRTQTKHTEANRPQPNRGQPKRIKTNRVQSNRTQPKHMEANRTEPKCIQSDLTQSNRTQPKRIKTNRIEQNRTEPKFIESDLTQSNRTHPKHIKSNRTQTKHTEANRPQPNRAQPKRIKTNRIQSNRTQPKHMKANRTEPKCIESDLTQSNRTQPKRIKTNRTEQNRTQPKRIKGNRTEQNRTQPKRIKGNCTEQNRTQPKRIKGNRTQPKRIETNRTEPNRTEPHCPNNNTHGKIRS